MYQSHAYFKANLPEIGELVKAVLFSKISKNMANMPSQFNWKAYMHSYISNDEVSSLPTLPNLPYRKYWIYHPIYNENILEWAFDTV